MKNQLITILFTCLLGISSFGQNTIRIKGSIKNPSTNFIRFTVFDDIFLKPKEIDIQLNATNGFDFVYPTEQVVRITFTHFQVQPVQQWHEAPVFYEWVFEPKDAIEMSFDSQNFWNTLKIEGKNKEKFQYYIEDFINADIVEQWRNRIEENEKLPISDQFKYLDKILQVKMNTFSKYEPKLSTFFKNFQKSEIKTMVLNNKVDILSKTLQNPSIIWNNEPAIQNFLNQIIHDSELFSNEYLQFCNGFMAMKMKNLVENSASKDYMSIVPATTLKVQEALKLSTLAAMLRMRSTETKGMLEEFKKEFPASKYITSIENQIALLIVVPETINAPIFEFKNHQGENKSIADYKEKVVLIDFWASWCGPCINEIPYSKTIKKHFKDRKDLVFLYISSDNTPEKWLDAIKKYNIEGEHLLANEAILEQYKVNSFPTYMIVGKSGKFININAPRPSENDGKTLINALEDSLNK